MSDYKYADYSLSTMIVKELILELYPINAIINTTEVKTRVIELHQERGGVYEGNTSAAKSLFTRALSELKDEGILENPVLGYWRVIDPTDTTPRYSYHGIPLIPSIAKEFLLEYYTGDTFTRKEASEFISETHIERGGLPENYATVGALVKQSLQVLRRNGQAEYISHGNPQGRGRWRIFDENEISEQNTLFDDIDDEDDESDIVLEQQDTYKTIGTGDESVYMYYFSSDKELAELKGNNVYPCKIGKSNGDPVNRIMAQLGTSNHEMPILAFVMQTDSSSVLENVLQGILRLQNKMISGGVGKEWFMTSPEQIEDIYKLIHNGS